MVLQKALEGLFGLFVFDPGLLFLLLLCLNLVGIKCLFLLTQLGQGTARAHTHTLMEEDKRNKGSIIKVRNIY